MKYFSMFSGIGGFELGIQRAFDNEHAHISEKPEQEEREQGGEWPTDKQEVLLHNRDGSTPLCVGYSEIDKYAIQTYERHFKHDNYGSATDIVASDLPDFDLLVGGFPCQAFSIAGKRNGFNDTRGTLFFDIARVLAEKRPRHLVLENVKGLLSHEQGKTFQTILGVLADLGYRVEWQVLNSKDFGVPQNRERVYIVGHLGNGCGRQVFPITRQSNKYSTLGSTAKATVARTLTGGGHSGGNHSGMTILQVNQPTHSNDRVYSDEGISPTLNTMQGGNRQPFIAAQRGRENGQVLEPQTEDKSNTLTAVAKGNTYIVSDMVILWLESANYGLDDYAPLGGVFRRAAKQGIIKKIDQPTSTKTTLWISQIREKCHHE